MEDPVEWEQDLKGRSYRVIPTSPALSSYLAEAPSHDGPRPPSEFDEDEADELAALAEDEAYWDALGNTDNLDDLSSFEDTSRALRKDEDMDMS